MLPIEGRISLPRALLSGQSWNRVAEFRLFLVLLAAARERRDPYVWHGVEIGYGQLLRSIRGLQELLVYEQNNAVKHYAASYIHELLHSLERAGRVTLRREQKGFLITVVDFEQYQESKDEEPRTEKKGDKQRESKEKPEKKGEAKDKQRTVPEDSRAYDCDFNAGWEGTKKLIHEGWPDGTRDMVAACQDIQTKLREQRDSVAHSVCGIEIDMQRFLQGHPEHWFDMQKEDARRVFKIWVNGTVSCSVPASQIKNRGGAIMAVIEHLQQYPENIVELYTVCAVSGGSSKFNGIMEVHVPLGVTPIDYNAASFALAHPGFLRRLMFSVFENMSGYSMSWGYGRPCEPRRVDDDVTLFMPEICSGNGAEAFNTPESSAKWVRRAIATLEAGERIKDYRFSDNSDYREVEAA